MMMQSTIGSRIARLRKEKRMTQEDLAEKLGVSSQAVSKWEKDGACPDISLLTTLADVLGVTTDELLSGKSETVRMVPPEKKKNLEELTLRVRVLSKDGDKVKINLPMPLVKVTLELGIDMGAGFGNINSDALKNIDLAQIMMLAEQGVLGKLVEVESADGDTVEVVVE